MFLLKKAGLQEHLSLLLLLPFSPFQITRPVIKFNITRTSKFSCGLATIARYRAINISYRHKSGLKHERQTFIEKVARALQFPRNSRTLEIGSTGKKKCSSCRLCAGPKIHGQRRTKQQWRTHPIRLQTWWSEKTRFFPLHESFRWEISQLIERPTLMDSDTRRMGFCGGCYYVGEA